MIRQELRARRSARAAAFIGVVAGLALAFVPAATEGSVTNGLQAFVAASTRGPLTACQPPFTNCADGNTVWDFIYVSNGNPLTSAVGGPPKARDTVDNALIVSSVEYHAFVGGVEVASDTFTPPPFPTPPNFRAYAARWVETVACPAAGPPCNEVRSPAVLPGEKTAVLFVGWTHGSTEPNGKYVFKYTVHGTLNGTPVDVTASSVPIFMTD